MNEDAIKRYTKEYPKRDVAVVGLRDANKNILLMRTKKLSGFWQPIGGGVESSDASPQAAAVRELEEEFGFKLDPATLTEILTLPYDFGEGTIYFFEAMVNPETVNFHIDPEEVIEYRWFSKEEAIQLPTLPASHQYLQQL